jgi:hypothetical protein
MAGAVFSRIQDEISQGHGTRKQLYADLERELDGRHVIAFFTSFVWPVTISDADPDMIEEALEKIPDDGKEIVLLINSPGGEGVVAERIVNVLRSYSPTGKFSVIVPRKAKSAATMICFGACRIGMSKTSELGPVDPQIAISNEKGQTVSVHAAHEIIESYEELMDKANRTKGKVEPYLQQLARFDAKDIRRIRSAQALSASISINCLRTGVMTGRSHAYIEKKLKPFLDPTYTKTHSRPIYRDTAEQCGLPVESYDLRGTVWTLVSALYMRLNHYCTARASKAVETHRDLYSAPLPEN